MNLQKLNKLLLYIFLFFFEPKLPGHTRACPAIPGHARPYNLFVLLCHLGQMQCLVRPRSPNDLILMCHVGHGCHIVTLGDVYLYKTANSFGEQSV